LSGEPEDSNRFEEIDRQIKESKKEQKLLKLRTYFLTAHGAVLRPVVILTLALIFACLGIYSFYEQDMGWTIGFAISSALTILTAIVNLYQTISIIEYAALRPARTIEFDVSFGNGKKITQLKRGKESVVRIFASTSEADVNNCVMYVTIPAQIEVATETKTEKITVSKHPNLSLIADMEGFCPKNWKFGLRGTVVPKKIGRYTVDVSICAEGIYEYKEELILNVVK
jgi:hypothetical protein